MPAQYNADAEPLPAGEALPRPKKTRHRPCKQKRQRLERLVQRLINAHLCPDQAERPLVWMPPSLFEDKKLWEKVMRDTASGLLAAQRG